ncbi:Cysteine dioxygenase type I [Nakamurella panacisegetis]|uniref:Cysteine dioxygenase type I n=1 Tax=Nakamurella panacisegetis TaxID=1090615 RepID=A0A1H0NW36_9ACTN|nr:cysteine dioxygenase family protein [Nakamurella panacisegetis]SDO96967.1 Cysteine dioxygenase type I [Nakamurella panacisegetis]
MTVPAVTAVVPSRLPDDLADEAATIVTLPSTEGRPVNGARLIADVVANATGGITLENLPGRDLDSEELRELAAGIAADTNRWAEHVAFSDDKRHYVSLHRDTHVDIWVLCWTPQNDTGWHDHDISSGAVAVTQGCLTEHNLAVGAPSMSTDVQDGLVFAFGPDHIHRLTGRDAGSVSIHAYSPPLWRMGQYTVSGNGMLRRRSVSYADELRPLDDMI